MSERLVLIGGGHSHAIALDLWGKNPLPGVSLTVITDVENTPYSGMLPGYVAGFYTYEETHINLPALAKFAGAKLIVDRAISLDLNKNRVICQNHFPIDFDYLSIDIGSTPKTISVPGAKEYAIPAKPVPLFLEGWETLLQQQKNYPDRDINISIVGGGAGGVELALNMYARLKKCQIETQKKCQININVIHRGAKLLSGHNNWVSKKLEKILLQRGIKLYLETTVTKVVSNKVIGRGSNSSIVTIPGEHIFWVTQASPPEWIADSGIGTDKQGFILVKNTLQSQTHPRIFATGDIATNPKYPRPKAGVFAVRQGKPLFNNLRSHIQRKPLQDYIPQKKYLALIGTGNKSAIASWGKWGLESRLLWYIKDYIDRKFMKLIQKIDT